MVVNRKSANLTNLASLQATDLIFTELICGPPTTFEKEAHIQYSVQCKSIHAVVADLKRQIMYSLYACVPQLYNVHVLQAVSVIKSLGGNVKMLVTNPKEEEEGKRKDGTGK